MAHWVIIEAGSKQRFIFGTNKRRANVGASQLVYETQDWVRDAIAACAGHGHGDTEVVLLDSGTANLIVSDPAVGVCLIGQVTRTALDRAPGLDVWGVTHPIAEPAAPMAARGAAYRALDHARGMRPSSLLRGPMLPVTAPCRYTGRPATDVLRDRGLTWDSTARPAAAGVDELAEVPATEDDSKVQPVWVSREFRAAYEAGNPMRRDAGGRALRDAAGRVTPSPSRLRLAGYIPEQALGLESPNEVLCRTDQEFTGWVGLMHADGDGMGALFMAIGEHGTSEQLAQMSDAVRDLATQAVRDAVISTHARARELGVTGPWLLPLIVGGDDVTALVDGRVAVDFAVAYARCFDAAFDAPGFEGCRQILAGMRARDARVPQRLTVSAGVAVVKPHHPFHDAAELAEELCGSAKKLAVGSTVDFHVLFDSVGTHLDQVRRPLRVPGPDGKELALWGGPYTTAHCACEESYCTAFSHLEGLVTAMREPVQTPGGRARPLIGGTLAHRIRDALTVGGPAITRAQEQTKLRAGASWRHIDGHLVIPVTTPADDEPGYRSRWLDALALSDVEEGTGR